jgi:apolipoprotein N-acyltransferase
MRNVRIWVQIAAAVASGLLVAVLFAPFDQSWLVWVAMLPLLWALGSVTGKRVGWKGFGIGYVAGLVSSLVQLQWLGTVSWLGVVLLSLYLAIYWGLFGAFASSFRAPHSGLRTSFCQAAVWAGLEWLRGWLFTGFGWNGLGVAFHEMPVMAQGADLLGVTGLSLMVVFVQALVLQVAGRRGKSRVGWDLGIAAALVAGWYGYGKWRIASEGQAESVRLKTLLVQINIPQDAARMLWTDLQIHQAYEDETVKALDGLKAADGSLSAQWPDWVMWPECALTGRILRTNDGEWGTWQINQDTLAQVRVAGPFSLIYGVNELEAEKSGEELVPKSEGRAYNSIAVMSPEDELQTYRKRHLVIFGETIPFVDSLPWLKKIYEQQAGVEFGGSFTPGESLEPLPIMAGATQLGAIPTICFEDTVGRLTRKFLRPGPQVIINVTNDGWFKESAAAAQHFANAKFRAIELRRPMLRCANSGVSAAIDSTGAAQTLVDAKGCHFTRGSLLTDLKIPLRPSATLFGLIGDWGILLLAAIGVGVAVLTRKSGSAGTGN